MHSLYKCILVILLLVVPVVSFSNSEIDNEDISVSTLSSSHSTDIQTTYIPEQIGDQHLFWVLNGPDQFYFQMRATLLSIGSNSYVYMANETIETLGQNESITNCEVLSTEFDLTIYPKAIELAGHPDGIYGDIDGDPHLTIFLAPLVQIMGTGYLGFYDVNMENPYSEYSNVREMVYIDSDRNLDEMIPIIIHEYNHLIWYNNERDESQFLTEGLACYATDYTGFSSITNHWVTTAFLSHPEISLLYFNRNYGPLWDASYGQAYLFMIYFIEQFGVETAKDLVSIPEDAAYALQKALINNGFTIPFNQVFLNWITACVIDDTSFADGIYGFESVNYMISAYSSICFSLPVEKVDIPHYYYGFRVNYIIPSGDEYTFIIDNPYPLSLGVSIAIKDINGWNVTQKLVNQASDKLVFYITGEDIQDVYIITSLMKPTTPSEYGMIQSLDEIISSNLNYKIYHGIYYPETEKSYFGLLSLTLTLAIPYVIVISRRKKN